jgi:hypothetical protein
MVIKTYLKMSRTAVFNAFATIQKLIDAGTGPFSIQNPKFEEL